MTQRLFRFTPAKDLDHAPSWAGYRAQGTENNIAVSAQVFQKHRNWCDTAHVTEISLAAVALGAHR